MGETDTEEKKPIGNISVGDELAAYIKAGKQIKEPAEEKEKREFQKSVNLTKTENEQFEDLKIYLGVEKDSATVLYCIQTILKEKGPEIKEKAQAIKEIMGK